MLTLRRAIMPTLEDGAPHGVGLVTFQLCAFGTDVQKYTSLLASPRLASLLAPLSDLRCTHSSHARVGGQRTADGKWASAAHAAYPAALNAHLARVLASLVVSVREFPDAPDPSPSADRPAAPSDSPDPVPVDAEPPIDAVDEEPPFEPPSPSTGEAPAVAAVDSPSVAPSISVPHAERQRVPRQMGGERAVYGTPIRTRSRGAHPRPAGASLVLLSSHPEWHRVCA